MCPNTCDVYTKFGKDRIKTFWEKMIFMIRTWWSLWPWPLTFDLQIFHGKMSPGTITGLAKYVQCRCINGRIIMNYSDKKGCQTNPQTNKHTNKMSFIERWNGESDLLMACCSWQIVKSSQNSRLTMNAIHLMEFR